MENLNKLYNLTLRIKADIYDSGFKKNDVRKAYFENLYSIVKEFYRGKIFFKVCQEIKEGTLRFDSENDFTPHLLRIYEIAVHNEFSNAYHNDINRKLFVDSFTNFETTISLCFEDIADSESLNLIIKNLNSKILRISDKLSDEAKELLLAELIKTTFIPLSRKFRFLSKLQENCYPADFKEDLEFVEFCSRLRNCVSHSAGYYKGKDYEYEIGNIKFIFKEGAFLEMTGENNYVFLEITERLTNIIHALTTCLKEIDFIKYPDDGF
jgi:hypothetical protein